MLGSLKKIMGLLMAFMIVSFAVLAAPVAAADTEAITSVVFAGVSWITRAWDAVAWIMQNTSDGTVLQVVLSVGGLFGLKAGVERYVKSIQDETRRTRMTKLFDFFKSAAREVGSGYVRDLKSKSDDGKLTPEEREEARARAFEIAKQKAMSEGVDIVKECGQDLARELTERAVAFWKSRGTK